MVQIYEERSVIPDRERERSRLPHKNLQNQNDQQYGIPIVPQNYAEVPANHRTVSHYGPAPSLPLALPMSSQNQNELRSYPPPIPSSYPPLVHNSYPPPMYYGMPQCWMSPYQQNVMYAPPALPDPTKNLNSALCSKHGKRRTLVNLRKDEKTGEWVCTKASECRIVPSFGSEICSIHGKKRSLQNLSTNAQGEFVCEPHDKCIVVPNNLTNKQLCAIHGKMRSLLHLVQSSPGIFVCAAGSNCYVNKYQAALVHQGCKAGYLAPPSISPVLHPL